MLLPSPPLLAATSPGPCPAAPFRATILQLLRRDAARPPDAWRVLMRELKHLGIRDLILQWTSFDATDFYGGRQSTSETLPVLPTILRAAHAAGLHVWIGLHQDPEWWSAASRPATELDAWLAGRLADLDARLPSLARALTAAPRRTVSGWYLTDELDDGSWQAPEREAALARYLRATTDRLRRASPGRPTAISAFANGVQDVAAYGAQLRRVTAGAGIGRLLVQDAIGAGKRTPDQARETAQAVARALRGGTTRLGMVVELFDLRAAAKDHEAATAPAPVSAILARLAATAGIGNLPITSFSHAHHLSAFGGAEAAERGAEWSRLLARCGAR